MAHNCVYKIELLICRHEKEIIEEIKLGHIAFQTICIAKCERMEETRKGERK